MQMNVRFSGWVLMVVLGTGCARPQTVNAAKPKSQILFICEHGNVKSLMAATYFNQLAESKHLPVRAIARGVSPDSTSVPAVIVDGMRRDGFDVAGFHPEKVQATDLGASERVVLISTELPLLKDSGRTNVESWVDVPPASTEFAESSRMLKRHVARMVESLTLEPLQ